MRLIDADEAKEQVKQMQTLNASERMLFRMVLSRTPTYEPPNDPLTLEELEGMVGEPLYVIPAEKDPDWKPCWVICMEDYILVNSTTSESRVYILRRNEDYGKTWQAYRRRPEEGTDVSNLDTSAGGGTM